MDSFSTQKIKSRKTKRPAKKSRVQIILDLLFRAVEIIVVLVTVAKLCYQLAITFEDSGVAAVINANRNLAFLIGNVIVIALIAKSGLLLNQEQDPKCKRNDLYEEFVRESSRRDGNSQDEMRNRGKQSEARNEARKSITETRAKQCEETEKEKQSITENMAKQRSYEKTEKLIATEKKMKQSISEKRFEQSKPEKMTKQSISVKGEEQRKTEKMAKQSISVKGVDQIIVEHHETAVEKLEKQNLSERRQIQSYQRCRSENLEGLEKSSCVRLRRSETDASSERYDSDDELRYKIESFIARQRRNQNYD
ncbi:unnamed protein product [Microthlaspi erraticum]|uniref:DUF4408 domain-containing protein n=1 Tax=Microthlaspi erraticum TaxID=1685480 RepID=A0A6D2HXZ4_9BRAS|nr:unnamed protein product [Microthlaspi erraticum]